MEHFLTHLLTNTLMGWMKKKLQWQAVRDQKSGRFMLTQQARFRWIARCLMTAFLLFLVLILLACRNDPGTQISGAILFGSMATIMLWWFYEAAWTSIYFDEKVIHVIRPTGKHQSIPWNAVIKANYSTSMNWFALTSRGYPKVYLNPLCNGMGTFIVIARSQMNEEVWRGMTEEIEKRYRAWGA